LTETKNLTEIRQLLYERLTKLKFSVNNINSDLRTEIANKIVEETKSIKGIYDYRSLLINSKISTEDYSKRIVSRLLIEYPELILLNSSYIHACINNFFEELTSESQDLQRPLSTEKIKKLNGF
jgi:hypothetical protein